MQKFIQILFVVAFLLSLSACNTIAGVGRDLSQAGDAIEGAANKNKKRKKD